MAETIKEQERILVENQVLRQQVEKLRQENALLQAQNIQLRQNSEVVSEDVKPSVSEEWARENSLLSIIPFRQLKQSAFAFFLY